MLLKRCHTNYFIQNSWFLNFINQSWYVKEPKVQQENLCLQLQHIHYQLHYLLKWKKNVFIFVEEEDSTFSIFSLWNNYQPSWQYRSNTVHHCTLKRRSPFINIKPIWAEKLQCPNDVYTSALMSLLSDIAALPAVFISASLHRKD